MLFSMRRSYGIGVIVLSLIVQPAILRGTARADVTGEEVEQAIQKGVRFLKDCQLANGSWPDGAIVPTGTTSLAVLALLATGESPDSVVIQSALAGLRPAGPQLLNSTYAVGLQNMVFAAAEPDVDRATRRQRQVAGAHAASNPGPGPVAGKLDVRRRIPAAG